MNLTPKETVRYLDEYIIGQKDAKKAIAIALRNRYRRMQLSNELQDEIMPKNILMIGSTGVGKTEIARRLAKMMNLPFVKVEASKYTEVGFVGRDVESMVRDLTLNAYNIVKNEFKEQHKQEIDEYVEKKIIEKLLPPLPKGATDEKIASYKKSFEKMRERLRCGDMDELSIEIEIEASSSDFSEESIPPEVIKIQESFSKMLGSKEKIKKEVKVKEAREILKKDAGEDLMDLDSIKKNALERAQNGGIIFIDEIDKIATSNREGRSDPSKEGVQRDLLPIVEGSDVSTKYGIVKTDHILFIAAGAFHVSKPSDLIPELQGRFPLRVELQSLDKQALYHILTKTKNSLLRQYEALLEVEGVTLRFDDDAISAIAKISQRSNELLEDIGARRLHTVIEKILEDISFDADMHSGETITVTKELVHEKLDTVIENDDSARYIL
jgi:ATP-dependent HslUV protease ATP-binding subunit HslU